MFLTTKIHGSALRSRFKFSS